jgi:hypothetical protein
MMDKDAVHDAAVHDVALHDAAVVPPPEFLGARQCFYCKAVFPSRNQLFKHLRDARIVTDSPPSGKKKNKKNRKAVVYWKLYKSNYDEGVRMSSFKKRTLWMRKRSSGLLKGISDMIANLNMDPEK